MKERNLKNKNLKQKSNKGITLVALIITIIVLLILAVVAISAVNNAGIIQYAQNSADEYKDGRDKENTTLVNYVDILNHYETNKKTEEAIWGEFQGMLFYIGGDTLTLTSDTIQVEVINVDVQLDENGDFVSATYSRTGEIKTAKITDYANVNFQIFGNNIKSVDFGGKLNSVSNISFACTKIENIMGLDGISRIPEYMFEYCTTLKSITIPNSVLEIGENAFEGCDSLKNVTISNGVEIIGKYAFYKCDKLEEVTIPDSVTLIDVGAFKELANIKKIYYNSTKENWSKIYSYNAFNGSINAEVICTDGKYKIENGKLIDLAS